MVLDQLKPNVIVQGSIFPESVQVIVAIPMGASIKLIGKSLNSNLVHEPILSPEQIAQLEATPEAESFDGDPNRFRIGVEAFRLELAYEYDPHFSLSIARVDPLPHQLGGGLRLLPHDAAHSLPARRRPGLLLKELKIRGLGKWNPHHHAGKPVLSVAARDERKIP
jgi:hypothetical protein